MDKDDHLETAYPLHYFLVKYFVYHEHFAHSFLFGYSDVSLLEWYGTIGLVEVEQSLFFDSQTSPYVTVIGQSGW